MGNTCKPMTVSFQCMTKLTTIKKKKKMDWGLAFGSDDKEPACNAGDQGLIPGSGRSQEKKMSTHSSIVAWRIPMDRGAWRATVHGVTKSQTRLSD